MCGRLSCTPRPLAKTRCAEQLRSSSVSDLPTQPALCTRLLNLPFAGPQSVCGTKEHQRRTGGILTLLTLSSSGADGPRPPGVRVVLGATAGMTPASRQE